MATPASTFYAHAPVGATSVLLRVDPTTGSRAPVGVMAGCAATVIDLAIAGDGTAYATTGLGSPARSGVYRVDLATGACTLIRDDNGTYPNNLTMLPAGVLGAAESLVAFDSAGNYITIDRETGDKTIVTPRALGETSVSGDIVATASGPTYVTVTEGSGACPTGTGDCLLQVDPATGTALRNFGGLGAGGASAFGITEWAGRVWVATGAGTIGAVDIDEAAGTATIDPTSVTKHPSTSFYGAATSTTTPAPSPKAQKPVSALGLPARVTDAGWTRVIRLPVRTNAEQDARVRVTCVPRLRSASPAGDARTCRIVRTERAVRVWLSGARPTIVRVVVAAPATDGYTAYRSVRTYLTRAVR